MSAVLITVPKINHTVAMESVKISIQRARMKLFVCAMMDTQGTIAP